MKQLANGRTLFRSWRLLFPLLLIFVVAAQGADYYQTVETDGLRISLDIWSSMGSPGYIPVNLDITNLATAERTIEITSQSQGYARYSGYYYGEPRTSTLDLHQSIRLKRGDRQRLTIALPVSAENENIQLQIRERNRVIHRIPLSFQTVPLPELAPALIVANPSSAFGQATRDLPRTAVSVKDQLPPGASEAFPPGQSPYTISGKGPIDVTREPDRLPANWLGFTTFRAVFIGTQEWETLSAAQKDALLAWTASGGDLSFVGGEWQTLFPDVQRRPAAMGGKEASQRYLLGQIFFPNLEHLKSKGLETTLSDMRTSVSAKNPVSGADRFITGPEYAELRSRVENMAAPGSQGNQDYSKWRLPIPGNVPYSPEPLYAQNGFRLPIPGVTGVSTRVYLAILVLFTLLIGPLNYFYLKRKRQQVLMVVTTPLISIVFIVLLAGYAIAGEGFSIRARAETFTFLDQVSKQAATRAAVSLYAAGMAPGDGLRFPRDLAVFPSRESLTVSLDLTESQRYASGLLQARTPVNFDQVVFRTARERLTFSRDGSGISVTNALEGSVQRLFYRDGGRVYVLTAPVPPGAHGKLRPAEVNDLEAMMQPDGKPSEPWPLNPSRGRKFQHFFLNSLEDGAFFAVLDRSPFWEPGTPGVEERGSFHVVAGYAGGQP